MIELLVKCIKWNKSCKTSFAWFKEKVVSHAPNNTINTFGPIQHHTMLTTQSCSTGPVLIQRPSSTNQQPHKAIIPGTSMKNKNLHECGLCEFIFTQKTDLNRHMKTVHNTSNTSQEKFQCKICDKDFQRIDNLQRHEKIHQKFNIKIVCEVCLKHFNTKDDLKMHRIAYHEKE